MHATSREWWGKFADSEPDRIAGKHDQLTGALREKYDDTIENADKKTERHLREHDQKHIASELRARRTNKRQSIGW